ncbi:leucine--tRNA ligase [Candidatus Woesebacteria bacterium CG07_land_8_20_14_0_80_44_9]|uniref:Leucine--tRNA ligase n=1 Tax=Candidatus Woesebacteria bacterium CG07_land_8_20_14_0_80_44_9 TaxID=1975058 RepID=A0A2M6YFC0_9BACT|nr:MAG: leucine--tRNA ligase [Candidatus Woesebacteria bacterium CG07_land_8_20_14_0_80_44_9]
MKDKYDHQSVEAQWQKRWQKEKLYSPNIHKAKNPFYNLWMFPYPSAEGVHVGTIFSSTGSDIYGRFMRMRGKDVFQPMGYDSFGIHSENYALKIGEPPAKFTGRAIKNYERQFKEIGHGYDWTRTVTTSSPGYYRWTQWLFIQLFKAGLAYKKKAPVNFCPHCKTVLADEQVIAGECERCQARVEKKELEQWFFAITKYADRLLEGLAKIDWSERVIKAQREWIGKSEGMLIKFGNIEVFTTRPDTLNAVTFLATSRLYDSSFAKATEGKEKIGIFTGKYAVNPLDGRKLPIWDTNYVAPDYGTGIIMGVPAHDERDLEFAKKYHIDIVNKEPDQSLWERVENNGWGKKRVNYHLRDWLVSRQRYWGAPIPMVYCEKCRWVTVPEKDLPVLLPSISDYKPEGTGKGPLANHPDFYKVACPKCGLPARRETDVMDTFVDSSWYFLRYPSVSARSGSALSTALRAGTSDVSITKDASLASSQFLPWDPEITKKWLPVDFYFGGAEHSVLHLMYSRFVTMVLSDLGYLDFEEPFPRFFAHGLMIKDGAKMSKSRGNVVNPDEYIAKYGADTLRLYLMFMGPMDGSPDFRDDGIGGMGRFVNRLWRAFNQYVADERTSDVLITKLHQTIKKVTEDIEGFDYNTAIASMMEFLNLWEDEKNLNAQDAKLFVKILAPFAPHLAEEVYQRLKVNSQRLKVKLDSVHTQSWPKYDPKLVVEESVTVVVQVNGKLRGQLEVKRQISNVKSQIEKLARQEQKVSQYLKGQQVKKVIFVPGKLVNFVTV